MIQENGLIPESAILTKLASQKALYAPFRSSWYMTTTCSPSSRT